MFTKVIHGLLVISLVGLATCGKGEDSFLEGALKTKRDVSLVKREIDTETALKIGKFALSVTIRLGALVFPPLGLLIPFMNLLWPTASSNTFEKIKGKVTALIKVQIDANNAQDLADTIKSLKTMMTTYNGYSDDNVHKRPKIVAINTLLESKEAKFMNPTSPVTTFAYFIPFAQARLVVFQELIRMTPPKDKQETYNAFLKLLMRYIPYLSHMVYGKVLEDWRNAQLSCKRREEEWGEYYYLQYSFRDSLFPANDADKNFGGQYDPISGYNSWCAAKKSAIINPIKDLLSKVKENIPAWGSTFNAAANSRYVKGFKGRLGIFASDGDECDFPFTYKGNTYYACTTVDRNGVPWCKTKSGASKACELNTGTVGTTTTAGDECKLPFTYSGTTHSSCTTNGNNGVYWCYTKAGSSKTWGNCVIHDQDKLILKTLIGDDCKIPFTYRGVSYNTCANVNNGGYLWCYTKDGSTETWGNCVIESVYSITTEGVRCQFPFTYDGELFHSCTKKGNDGKFWCMTDSTNYGNCLGDVGVYSITTEGVRCQFPFTYDGELFHSCTKKGNDGKFWCMTDSTNYGNCLGDVDKLDTDLTSCTTKAPNSMQYFGHAQHGGNGKTCMNMWAKQDTYKDFPMDAQNRTLAYNYCRRLIPSESGPGCYTSSGWSYCTQVPSCTKGDWS